MLLKLKKAAYKEYSKAYNDYANNPLNSFTKKGAQKGNLMVRESRKIQCSKTPSIKVQARPKRQN